MEIRYFRNDEWDKLLAAIDTLWAHNHIYCRNPELLKYLVYNTPYREKTVGEGNTSFLGIFDNDEVLGLLGYIPLECNVFGKEYTASTGTIVKVDKEKANFLGLDLFNKMLENKQTIHLGIGINNRVKKLYSALGYYVFEDLTRWIGTCNHKKLKEVFYDSNSSYMIDYLQELSTNSGQEECVFTDFVDENEWNKFYNEKFSKRTIGISRNYKFLKWRYFDYPFFDYQILAVKNKKNEIEGLAIYRIEEIDHGKYKISRIVEFIYNDIKYGIALAKKMVSNKEEILFWDFYCASAITATALEYIGFKRLPENEKDKYIPTRFQPIDYNNMNI